MAKHPPLKGSMKKGVRAVSSPPKPPPNIGLNALAKMKKLLFEELLTDGKVREELDPRQLFVVDHVQKVIFFHLGQESYQEVDRHFKEGHRVNFSEEEISALTYLILEQKEKNQLYALLNELEGKVITKANKNKQIITFSSRPYRLVA